MVTIPSDCLVCLELCGIGLLDIGMVSLGLWWVGRCWVLGSVCLWVVMSICLCKSLPRPVIVTWVWE